MRLSGPERWHFLFGVQASERSDLFRLSGSRAAATTSNTRPEGWKSIPVSRKSRLKKTSYRFQATRRQAFEVVETKLAALDGINAVVTNRKLPALDRKNPSQDQRTSCR